MFGEIDGRINQRCRRICGEDTQSCFIGNKNQMACLSDMIINKILGVSIILESTTTGAHDELTRNLLKEAQKNVGDLMNWVKFLRISHDLRTLLTMHEGEKMPQKRYETRFPLPAEYQRYLSLRIRVAHEEIEATLTNFSRSGIQIATERPLKPDEAILGVLTTSYAEDKRLSFQGLTRYCQRQDDKHVTGIMIKTVSDSTDFDFFLSVFDLITETRKDDRDIGSEG